MDLIEVLWKQDVDLGFTVTNNDGKSETNTVSEEDQEKLKVLESLKEWPSESSTVKVGFHFQG